MPILNGQFYPDTINYSDDTTVTLKPIRIWFQYYFEGTATRHGVSAVGEPSNDPMSAAFLAVQALAKKTGWPVATL